MFPWGSNLFTAFDIYSPLVCVKSRPFQIFVSYFIDSIQLPFSSYFILSFEIIFSLESYTVSSIISPFSSYLYVVFWYNESLRPNRFISRQKI